MGGSVSGLAPACTRSLEPKLASFERKVTSGTIWNRLKAKALLDREPAHAKKTPQELINEAQDFRQLYRAMRKAEFHVQAETGASARQAIESIGRARKYVNGSIPIDDAMSVMKVQFEGELKKKIMQLLNAVVPYEDNERWTMIFIRNTFTCAGVALLAKFAIFGEGHNSAMVAFIVAPMLYTIGKAFVLPARTRVRFVGEKLVRLNEGGRAAEEIMLLESERAAKTA